LVSDRTRAESVAGTSKLLESSQRYVRMLWERGLDVSRFTSSISSLFTSLFSALSRVVARALSVSMATRRISIVRLASLPPMRLWPRTEEAYEGEGPAPELGRVNLSLLFRVSVARRIASNLARRISPLTGFKPVPLYPMAQTWETDEPAVEATPLGKPSLPLSHMLTTLSGGLEASVTEPVRTLESVASRVRPSQTVAPLGTGAVYRVGGVLSIAAAGTGLFRTPIQPIGQKEPSRTPLRAVYGAAPSPPESTEPAEAALARTDGGARGVSPLAAAAAALFLPFSRLSSPPEALEESPRPAIGSEIQASTTRSLAPAATSPFEKTAGLTTVEGKKVGTEAVMNPVLAPTLAVAELEAIVGEALTKAMTSLAAQPGETGAPILPTPGETYQEAHVTPVEAAAPPTTEPLPVRGLFPPEIGLGLLDLTRRMQLVELPYIKAIGEAAAQGPERTPLLGSLALPASMISEAGPPAPKQPQRPPAPERLRPVTPTVQSDLRITVSGEAPEEDLRDLERKISKILSEQIRRHYGHVGFEGI